MLLEESPLPPGAELGDETGGPGGCSEKWTVSESGSQVPGQLRCSTWATADLPGNSSRTTVSVMQETAGKIHSDFACRPGVEEKAVAARAVLCGEHKEVCSVMGRGSQTCYGADRCVLPPATFVSWRECHQGETCSSPSVSPCFLLPAPAPIFPSPFSLFHSLFYHN